MGGADVFQEDIFPDCYAGKPALSADEWLKGQNKDPIIGSMDPEKASDEDGGMVFQKKMTYQELEEENAALKARVKELEEQLGITTEDADGGGDAEQKEDAAPSGGDQEEPAATH